jgi:energy-coupling factor transport system ATP-binding protein
MINFEGYTITYAGRHEPALDDVWLQVGEGRLALTIGTTGAGKSTLLKSVNGLVPHFSGGSVTGRVVVDGRSTADYRPRDLADVVGYVGQDPDSSFVADVVEDELAYVMENLGVEPQAMRRRVEDVLDMLSLHPLRQRTIASLSGGQRQRVAIGAVLTAAQRALVLDEPTSSLDPVSAEEVLSVLSRLVHDLGVTVLAAEHRLERMVHAADEVVTVDGGNRSVRSARPAAALTDSPVAPPIVRLGRLLGWEPLPLSVRDARARAAGLRTELLATGWEPANDLHNTAVPGETLARARRLSARYGEIAALSGLELDIRRGEVLAVMGRNGSGKSTLLRHLAGLRRPAGGEVLVDGRAMADLRSREAIRLAGLVPQEVASLLDAETVQQECAAGDRDAALSPGTTRARLESLLPQVDGDAHPRDLSEGERLALALAVVLAPAPPLVLLDEPTRGLDYAAKGRLVSSLRELAAAGHGVVVATHDVELVAEMADRVVVLADGELITDGPVRSVLCGSGSHGLAPQAARIFAPIPVLTVEELESGLSFVTANSGALQGIEVEPSVGEPSARRVD